MAGIKNVDPKEVARLIEEGMSVGEIKKRFGLRSTTQIKNLYLDALIHQGKAMSLKKGQRAVKKKEKKDLVRAIGKRGTIALSRKVLVDQFGFQEGDVFHVVRRRNNIVLVKQ